MFDHGAVDTEEATMDLRLGSKSGDHRLLRPFPSMTRSVVVSCVGACGSTKRSFHGRRSASRRCGCVECGQGVVAVEVAAIEHEVSALLPAFFRFG